MPLISTGEPAQIGLHQAKFAMMDGAERVICYVDTAAIEDIEHGSPDLAERSRVFNRQRTVFERIASELYDRGARPPRVTTKDLRG